MSEPDGSGPGGAAGGSAGGVGWTGRDTTDPGELHGAQGRSGSGALWSAARDPGVTRFPAESHSRTYQGVGIGAFAVAGPVARMGRPPGEPADRPAAGGAAEENRRALEALAAVAADLRGRADAAGGHAADVLEAQAMMAEDPGVAEGVAARTAAGKTAARAVHETFGDYRALLAGAGEYMAARVADLDDVAARAVAAASGVAMPGLPERAEPYVLVAADLAPADTALLDAGCVLALVTSGGGPTSHTAILARARGIPAVVGASGVLDLDEGAPVLVDAGAGTVTSFPSADAVGDAAARTAAARAARTIGEPGRTSDHWRVRLLANIGGAADVPAALAAGAEGVGLFRTEFLFLGADVPPTLQEQVAAYREVFDAFPAGARVVVRTLDAGADKSLPFLPLGEEPNPALGLRGLRAFRGENEGMLRTQLVAIKAAADATASGVEVCVMAPMIDDSDEADWFAALAAAAGFDVAAGQVGVMVETPAAALTAGSILASAAGFASVGTNDLTQYAMAADRMLGILSGYQDPWHPAVLKLVAETGKGGQTSGKPVGVCGEAAADPLLACVLVGLGIGSLSMTPAALADVRAALAARTYEDCRAMAARALAAGTAREARRAAAA